MYSIRAFLKCFFTEAGIIKETMNGAFDYKQIAANTVLPEFIVIYYWVIDKWVEFSSY